MPLIYLTTGRKVMDNPDSIYTLFALESPPSYTYPELTVVEIITDKSSRYQLSA